MPGTPLPDLPGIRVPAQDEHGRRTRVVVLGGSGCHLCEVAQATVARVCAAADLGWSTVHLEDAAGDQGRALRSEHGERIPVIYVDGQEIAHWRVTEEQLRFALRSRRRWRIRDFVHSFTKS